MLDFLLFYALLSAIVAFAIFTKADIPLWIAVLSGLAWPLVLIAATWNMDRD